MTDSPEKKLYKGNCHCGKVRFTVSHEPLETIDIVRCNCSICTKNGYLNIYPKVEDVTFTHGYEGMSEYFSGGKTFANKFCGNCGTPILIDLSKSSYFPGKYAITIRTLEDIEEVLQKLKYTEFDGKNYLEPKYCLKDA